MARNAFYEGITHAQTKGKLNRWITSLYFKNVKANNIRIYGEVAYIFAEETLVTVIPVPVKLKHLGILGKAGNIEIIILEVTQITWKESIAVMLSHGNHCQSHTRKEIERCRECKNMNRYRDFQTG